MQYLLSDILELNDRFRRNLINSVHGFKSVALVGTSDPDGNHNLAIFSQIFHIGANPPLVGILVRPDSVDRHTLQNIRATQWFSINHIQEQFFKEAHQTSARYPQSTSEFDATGLTPEYYSDFPAPMVKESNVKMLLKRVDETELINGTILVTARIFYLEVPDEIIQEDGFLELHRAGTITSTGLDAYYTVDPLCRLSYAKVDMPLTEVPLNARQ
jgi:flavin reductase (DIM6/NTAB) family NADH-FMN oxidoreductase RutF